MELSATIIIAIIAGVIGILILITLIGICCHLRRRKSAQYKRAPMSDKSDSFMNHKENTVENIVNNNPNIINITDAQQKSINPDQLSSQELNSEIYRYLGISLSEIPFIDDSKCSSYVDLSSSWNPYQPLNNNS